MLSANVIGVGISERTQPAAIDRLAKHLLWSEQSPVRAVYAFSIPHKRSFMHLDTVFTQVDVDTFTVHPGILGTLKVFSITRGARPGRDAHLQMEGTLDQVLASALGLPAVRLIKCGETTQSLRRASSGTTAPTPWPCASWHRDGLPAKRRHQRHPLPRGREPSGDSLGRSSRAGLGRPALHEHAVSGGPPRA